MVKLIQKLVPALGVAALIGSPAMGAIISVDPDADATDGGAVSGSRINNGTSTAATGYQSVEAFVDSAITGRVLYIGFNMQSTGGFFHAFEAMDGSTNSANRVIDFGDESAGLGSGATATNLSLFVNDKGVGGEPLASAATSLGLAAQQHDYIIKVVIGAGGDDDTFSLFVDPTSTVEGSNTAEISALTGTDLTGITRVGFGSFVAEPTITYSNVHLATSFEEVATALGVPEPASLVLMSLGGLLMLGRSRRSA